MARIWNITDHPKTDRKPAVLMVLGRSIRPGKSITVADDRLVNAHKVHRAVTSGKLYIGTKPPADYTAAKRPKKAILAAGVTRSHGASTPEPEPAPVPDPARVLRLLEVEDPIPAVRVLRNAGFELAEADDIRKSLPQNIREYPTADAAKELVDALTEVGAEVVLLTKEEAASAEASAEETSSKDEGKGSKKRSRRGRS